MLTFARAPVLMFFLGPSLVTKSLIDGLSSSGSGASHVIQYDYVGTEDGDDAYDAYGVATDEPVGTD